MTKNEDLFLDESGSGTPQASVNPETTSLEDALQVHEQQIDALLKDAKKYVATLNAWKKACQTGEIGKRDKAAATATGLAGALVDPAQSAAESWTFDVREYLESGAWRDELRQEANRLGVKSIEEGETLICPPSPVPVRALPGQSRLRIGKKPWTKLRPSETAKEVKKLPEKSASLPELQRFLNALYAGCKLVSRQGNSWTKLKDLYDLFCLAPGWAKESSPVSFAQQIYALHKSDVRVTKDGKTAQFDYPGGKVKESDVFSVIADNGQPIRYFAIWFR